MILTSTLHHPPHHSRALSVIGRQAAMEVRLLAIWGLSAPYFGISPFFDVRLVRITAKLSPGRKPSTILLHCQGAL